MTLHNLDRFARRNPEHSGYIGQTHIGEGKYKNVTKGTYMSGEPTADKFLKTGVTFSSECFEDDRVAAEAALPYVAGFHDYVETTRYKGRVEIMVTIPQVWEQSDGRLAGQKMLREPFINNFVKFNSNSGAADSTAAVAQALSHYSYHASDGNELLCDLQGGKHGECYVLSDVVMMSKKKKYGNTDLGVTGIENWLNCHQCNDFCSSQWKTWSGARRLIRPVFSSTTILDTRTASAQNSQNFVRVRPSAINFTQNSIKYQFQDGHTLFDTALQIAVEDVGKRDIRMINVVRTSGGKLFALDNRRLAVFRLLEICGRVGTIKVEVVPISSCLDEWNQKCTTSNGGESIEIRSGGGHRIGKTANDTRFPRLEQIRNAHPKSDILSDERFSIFLGGFIDK